MKVLSKQAFMWGRQMVYASHNLLHDKLKKEYTYIMGKTFVYNIKTLTRKDFNVNLGLNCLNV